MGAQLRLDTPASIPGRVSLVMVYCLVCALGAAGQAPAQQPSRQTREPQEQSPAVKLGSNLVTIPVTVTDPYERLVTGLRKEHFEVYDDKVKQDVTFFAEEDSPISIGVVFDVSGSMKEKIQRARVALRKFVETSHPDDEFFLIAFNHITSLVQDFTTSGDEILSRLSLVEPSGRTALYDAAYLGVEKVHQGSQVRKAIIVISDGLDNSSRYTYSQLRNLVKEAGVQIYGLGIFSLNNRSDEAVGRSILEEITALTGGRAFFPDNSAELDDVITRIALELRHQYNVGFYPSNTARDGQWHKVRVRVNPPKGLPRLTVRTREGYYAAPN